VSRIYWDTMLFIYWLEDHPKFAGPVRDIHSRMRERHDHLLTATLTFGEVLAGVYRRGAGDRAEKIRQLLMESVDEVVPFKLEASDHYARIRAGLNVSPADAIHLASAAQGGTDLFLTNDKRLVGKFVPGIQFIASIEDKVL
jgi:uncharacterized protein